MIALGALLPHPPIMVEGIGRNDDLNQVTDTVEAMYVIDRMLEQVEPETLVVFTPHGAVFSDAIVIYEDLVLSGNLNQFGLQRTWQWNCDLKLAKKIAELGQEAGLPVYLSEQKTIVRQGGREGLDHGVLVPLSFFNPHWMERVKLVVIQLSFLPLEELYQFGSLIQKAAETLNKKVAVIASGDLSHCLKPGAPAGYDPHGAEFDQTLMAVLKRNDPTEVLKIDSVLIEKAAECGFRSVIMLLGTLDQTKYETVTHSYQGPFGVGYGIASFRPVGTKESLISDIFDRRKSVVDTSRRNESLLVKYAREVIAAYINHQSIPSDDGLESFQNEKAGVFVSIKKFGQLRGCIGTTEPTQSNIVREVKQNAVSAATRDPRFEPVEINELNDLTYSVDVLKPAEAIHEISELDPKRYGVIVSQGYRKGLLLPNLEGVDTAQEQVSIAKKKAGIGADEACELARFEVVRYY